MIRLITTLTVFIFLGLNAIAQTSVSLGYNSFFGNRGKVNVGNVVTRVNDSQLVVLYENSNNFQSGAFQVADYSGNTISSYGSTTYLGAVSGRRCINLEDNIMVICYNTAPGRVLNFRVGTASGTGSSAAMSMGNTLTSTYNANQFEFVPLTETTFLIAWEANSSNSEGYVAVGSISGTGSSASVSLGTPVLFEKQYAHNISIDTLSSEKFVVAYSDSDKDNGESIIGTVSNTTITIDNLKESGFYLADEVIDVNVMAISANQFVVSYSPTNTSTESGQAKVGTVSGNGITWSSAADTFETNLSYNQQVFGVAMDHNEVVLSYVLNGKGYISVGKVSGSGTGASILFSSGIKYTDWFYNENKITRLSETQLAVAYTFNNSSSISGQKTYGLYPGAIKIGSGAFAGFDYPEIAVLGNSNEIDNEDSSPSSTNHTHFGETPISGGTVSRTFTIENTGIGPLELTGAPYVEISGTNASDFTVSTQPSASIVSVSGSATFVVTFDPSTTGSRTATVSISSDDDDESTYTFDIEGEGIAPEIKISGNSTEILSGDDTPSSTDYTDFGDALVTSGTVSKSFTIENTGNSTLTLSGSSPYVSISGTNSSDFSVTYTPSNSIAIGSSTKFKIEFNPSDSGTRTATISIANDDSDENPYTFDIEGEGVEPEIKISGNNTEIVDGDDTPSSTDHTDFGNVLASSGTVSRTYTIENTGTSTLTLNGTSTSYIKITGTNSSDFTVTSQPSSATISANSSLTFVIEFDPSATGTRTATISASSDDSDEGFYNFDVEGEGIEPEIKISGNSTEIADGDAIPSTTDDTDFGSAVKTTGSVSKTYTIENTGGATLNLSGSSPYVSISGSNKSNFSVTSAPNNSIAAGSSTTFTVTFVPSAKGTREATLAISSDDADEGTYTFDIEGFGTSPEIRLRGNDIKISDGHTTPSVDDHTDFEETGIASGTISRTFTIDNLGTGDLVLGGSPIVALSGTNAADFEVITQPSTTTIAESDTAFFIIEFDPSAIGSSTATVTIESNDLNEATYTFTIEGTGINPEVKLSGNSNEIADGDATPSIKDHSYFGSVDESSATKTRTFTIENTGVGALNLTGTPLVSISGTNASDFSVTTQPSASEIAEDGSLTFVVEFNPSAVGVREAEVSFDCDDGDESTYNFSIAGLGSNKANYPFDWTWTGGSDTKNQSGTYGTKGTASSSNIPSARKGSMLWKAANGTVYLFGGKGKDGSGSSGLLNDLWKWDGSNWTWLAGSDDADQTGTYTGSTKTPGGRFGASGYIDASGNLWLFGGLGYYDTATEGYLNDLWKWDGSNWSWEGGNNAINTKANYGTQGQASASSWPRSASESNYWLDNDGNFWLFGGRGTDDNNNTGDLNDLWVWNGSQWAYMDGDKTRSSRGDFNSIGNATSSTEPSARRKGTQWVDENGDLYLFGGRGKDGNGATSWLSDLWKYDISAGRWTWMAGSKTGNEEGVYGTQGNTASGVYPGGRQKAVAWVDPSGNLVLYGGQGLDVNGDQGDLSDMWVWNGSQWAWTSGSDTRNDAGNYGSINATSSDNYPSGRADAMGWIDANGTIWFFGGDGIDASGNTGYLNDLWSMDMSFIWEGTSSTWSTNGNWKHGGVAKSGYPVKIPSGLSSYPTLSSDVALTDVEIENGASLTIGAGNTLSITGEFKYEGSTALALGDGKLKFNGTSAQTIDGKIDGNVEIDNSNDVSLGSDATIGTLTLTNGDLDIGDNDLTLENSSVGSSSAYIKLSGTGKVKATVGSSPVTLPIGRNPYLPIIIDDGGGAEYTVGLSENVYENPETNSTQQTTDVVGETWTIQASTSQNNVSVTLQWEAAEEETGFNRTTSNMAYWESGTSSTWDAGSSGTASGSGPYSLSRTVNFSTNLFYFGVGSAGSALPVEFTYFTSSWLEQDQSAILNWQTAMEENNSHFEVQRSFNGQDWEVVGQVQGQGSTFETTNYQFIDEIESPSHLGEGFRKGQMIYYRLKQIDYNGDFDYSVIKTLEMETAILELFVFPNPAFGNVINASETGDYTIFSAEGRMLESHTNTSVIYIGELEQGSYIIRNSKGQSAMFIRN